MRPEFGEGMAENSQDFVGVATPSPELVEGSEESLRRWQRKIRGIPQDGDFGMTIRAECGIPEVVVGYVGRDSSG